MDSLTVIDVHHCIDEILHDSNVQDGFGGSGTGSHFWHHRNLCMKRAKTEAECKALMDFVSRNPENDLSSPSEEEEEEDPSSLSALVPFFFALGLYPSSTMGTQEPPCGVVTMYSAYSTWDGRCLFIDRFDIPDADDVEMEKAVLRVLAKIAVKLGCARLNWRVSLDQITF
jgi:hypothetical protein